MDLTPWRASRDFRLLVVAGTVFYLGGMVTYVAVPYQLYRQTGSTLAVGLMGVVELVPLIVFGLYGGAVADHYDRRTVLISTGAAQVVLTAGLLGNAALPQPRTWPLYAIGAVLSAVQSLQRPSREALLPRTVAHDQLTAAVAMSSFGMQLGMVAGPASGGLLVVHAGPAWAYGVDVVGLLVATALYTRLGRHRIAEDTQPPSVGVIAEGLRYAVGRPVLLGTYVVDIIAMITAMPEVIYPAFATTVLHRPELLGLLYTAATVGSMIATATSRWTRRVHHHGRAVILAAAAWGGFVALAGLAPSVWLVLVCLAAAGASDMVSGLFRATIWNQTIPDAMRGRLAGIEMLSYSIGPLGGQVRAGVTADLLGVRRAIVGGGLVCVGGVAVAAASMPAMWRYDERTDEHAVRERRLRRLAAEA